jgi:hypothetical protein
MSNFGIQRCNFHCEYRFTLCSKVASSRTKVASSCIIIALSHVEVALEKTLSKYIEMRSSFEELTARNSKVKADLNFDILCKIIRFWTFSRLSFWYTYHRVHNLFFYIFWRMGHEFSLFKGVPRLTNEHARAR